MSKKPEPIVLTLRRDELAALVGAIQRPGAMNALGMKMDSEASDCGTSLRRAINVLTAAESKAKVDDAKRTLANQ